VVMLGGTGESAAGIVFPLWLALFLWGLAVTAHILRHALETSFATASLVAVGYLVVSLLFIETLFPRVA
ncbi:MAG: hypothetical protein R3298_09300, partial [Gammaproteobacteria bacterium]|nr:hypothetical protein [Gammaproteobacteria bacterium]